MNRVMGVIMIFVAGTLFAQTPNSPPLQAGIAVVLAPTANATPMPAADDENAWIVAVAREGALFLGTEKLTPEGLAEAMKKRPRNRGLKLYIKADAGAAFSDVEKVLQTGRAVGFDAPVLLTSQREQAAPGTIVPPQGLEVLVGPLSSTEAIVVQVLDTGESKPDVRVNGADVSVDVLRNTLGRMLPNSNERLVVLKAAGTLRFAQVAHVIDICRGAGVEVAVGGPEL